MTDSLDLREYKRKLTYLTDFNQLLIRAYRRRVGYDIATLAEEVCTAAHEFGTNAHTAGISVHEAVVMFITKTPLPKAVAK